MAKQAEEVGRQKAQRSALGLLTLAVIAGADIAFGALFANVATVGAEGVLPYGATRVLAGVVFSVGLILVVVGGAELFTGDNLMVMAWAARRIALRDMLRAWGFVYVGNFIGGVGTAVLAFLAGHYANAGGGVGRAALAAANAKASLPFVEAFFLGVLANVLVCLAVWLCFSARSTTDRILAIVPPIAAFVAAGFEHSVANMYTIPFGLLIKWFAPAAFWAGASPADFAALTVGGLVANLVPVTAGNIVGGGALVGIVYWFVYLRRA
ncbi:MAG: formate/nitrite transporter family protein [Rhodospirillales bacterium]|nr:formate/nitrite transporter family protein [Rhodospirillales bacterium]